MFPVILDISNLTEHFIYKHLFPWLYFHFNPPNHTPHPVTRNNVILVRSLLKCFRVTTTSCVISGAAVWSCMCLGANQIVADDLSSQKSGWNVPGYPETNSECLHLKMDGCITTFLLARPIFPGDLVVLGRVVYIGDVKISQFFWDYNTPLYECAFSRKIRTTPRDRTPRDCNPRQCQLWKESLYVLLVKV